MEEAHRERPQITYCVCRLGYYGSFDSCGARTSGPDEPVCARCVAANHPDLPQFDPIIKGRPRKREGTP